MSAARAVMGPHQRLRKHQEADLGMMIRNLLGTIIGATGCGKTRSQAAYIHYYFSNNKNPKPCVVVAPTISLVNQLTEEYFKFLHRYHKMPFQSFTLFSSKNEADWDEDITPRRQYDFQNLDTTSGKKIIEMYRRHVEICRQKNIVVPVIIFTTYRSLWKLSTNDVKENLSFHCVMFDEAHNIYTGNLGPSNGVSDVFDIVADKKFYFTATPPGDEKACTGLFNKANHGKQTLHTHYDMTVSGDVLPFRLMFLEDQRLAAVSTDEVLTYEQRADIILRAFNALHRACGTPTKMLVMLRNSLEVKNIAAALAAVHAEINIYATAAGESWTGDLYNGKEIGRRALLKQLKEHADENAIILNIRVLGEGIDVKGINGTLFLAGGSEIKINQNAGRAVRLNDIDRNKVYAGELTPIKDVDKYVKPFGWIIVPEYGVDGASTSVEVKKIIMTLRKQGAFIYGTASRDISGGAEKNKTGRVSKGAPDTSLIDIDVRTILEDVEVALRLEADEVARQELRDKINKMDTDELVAFIGERVNRVLIQDAPKSIQ